MTVIKRSGPSRLATTALVLGTLASGCASTTPDYDERFGAAVRASRQAQVINPQPAPNPELAQGMDGQAAQHAIQRYRDSFKTPPPAINVINVGASR